MARPQTTAGAVLVFTDDKMVETMLKEDGMYTAVEEFAVDELATPNACFRLDVMEPENNKARIYLLLLNQDDGDNGYLCYEVINPNHPKGRDSLTSIERIIDSIIEQPVVLWDDRLQ